MRVLLVEGDPVTREVLRTVLDLDGVEVDAVGTAAEADERVRAGGYDAAVVGAALPDGDGFELRRAWRDGTPPLTVALSPVAEDAARLRAREAGFDAWMATPFSPIELIDLLEDAAPGRRP